MRSKTDFYRLFFEQLARRGFDVKRSQSSDYIADIYFKSQLVAYFSKADTVIQNPFVTVKDKLIRLINDTAQNTANKAGICRDCPYTDANEKFPNGSYKLAEYNGVTLACKEHHLFGYVFSTYRTAPDSGEMMARQIFYNKEFAGQDFAKRSGLVDERALFTEEELRVLHAGLVIITYLGMGIVWFTDPPEQPEPTDYDYEYRVDTDVITPVTLYAGSEINPDSPATVSFSINGSTYRMNNIVIPSGDSQIAWVKWHTPSEPQDITIYVSTNKGSLSQSTIRAKVVDLSGNDPPDPKATDTMGSWSASSVPSRETKTYAAWSVWWAKWHPYWVWHSTGKNTGYWVDDGWYDYFRDNYSASITATTRIEPDEKVPTASGDLMKSGYGVTNTVTATVSTSAPLSHYTYGQTAVSYFPEFGYGTYWRLLERLTSGTTARFQFAKNIYSTYNQRVHFSPVWFPDGSYTVNTHVMDIWTPAGMLAMNLTDDVTISGSLYDDWHIAPGNP